MVSIKHKVTIKTKTAQEETPAAVGRPEVTLKRKQPEVANVPGIEPKPEPSKIPQNPEQGKKSNKGKIVGGIAAAAAIFAGVYFFGRNGEDKITDGQATTQNELIAKASDATQSETTTQTDVSEGSAVTEGETINNDSKGASSSETYETPVKARNKNVSVSTAPDDKQSERPSVTSTQPVQVPSKQGNSTSTKIVAASAPLGDDIVENAKRVIRGDFGNGQERKDKLGSAYAEIQSKVNEMYRQGRVYF